MDSMTSRAPRFVRWGMGLTVLGLVTGLPTKTAYARAAETV